jgi:hypothetical protein
MGREGNPKAEIRNPKEARNPKSEPVHPPPQRQSGQRSRSACYGGRVGLREARKKPDLSGHEHKYDDVRCAQFGLWRGARREHPPKWGCNRRATTPQAKFGATLRAAVLFRPDFVARSSQIHCGICLSLAPRLAEKSLAANVIVFIFMTT